MTFHYPTDHAMVEVVEERENGRRFWVEVNGRRVSRQSYSRPSAALFAEGVIAGLRSYVPDEGGMALALRKQAQSRGEMPEGRPPEYLR